MKQMKEPREYSGDRAQYREWRETLHADLGAHVPLYVQVLLWIEDLGRRPFRPEDLIDLATDMRLGADDLIEAETSLYTILTSYAGGTVKSSVRRFRPKGVFEAYRKLHFEGLRLTLKNAFQERALLWKVEEVQMDNLG